MIFYTFAYLVLFYGFVFLYMTFIARNKPLSVDCVNCCHYLHNNVYMFDSDNIMYMSACINTCKCIATHEPE